MTVWVSLDWAPISRASGFSRAIRRSRWRIATGWVSPIADISASGQMEHGAPTRTPREILRLGADVLGAKLRIVSVPSGLLPLVGLLSPFMRELAEMRFTWDRPYDVDSSKFGSRFWSDATPFESGVRATALSFRAAAQARTQVEDKETSAAASI